MQLDPQELQYSPTRDRRVQLAKTLLTPFCGSVILLSLPQIDENLISTPLRNRIEKGVSEIPS